MTDENPQDSSVAVADAGEQSSLVAHAEENGPVTAIALVDPASQFEAEEAPAPTASRILAYGAAAAILGILAGITFASFAGHAAAASTTQASASVNSKAAGLAELVKPVAAAPADVPPAAAAPDTDTPPAVRAKTAGHRRAKKKDAEAPETFAIEGDDELVGYDPSKGVIQTSARKVFVVSAATNSNTSAEWQDGPANIHYKCDLNANCTLSRRGAAVLYAQLKK
jgi:hypothetical protein